jgi:hypothetical protein
MKAKPQHGFSINPGVTMNHHFRAHPAAALLALGVLPFAAQADGLTLIERQTILTGSALVGYANVLYNSGVLSANDNSLDLSFDDVLADAGSVNGAYLGRPVTGSALFSAAQAFEVGAYGIRASGEAGGQTVADYSYMSAGANATSTLELTFTLDVATPFGIDGLLITGGTAAPAAVSLSCLSACSSTSWSFMSTGAFSATGTLNPGTWLLYGYAGRARVGPNELVLAGFDVNLTLAPVPEPPGWALVASGALVLGFLQRRRRRDPS